MCMPVEAPYCGTYTTSHTHTHKPLAVSHSPVSPPPWPPRVSCAPAFRRARLQERLNRQTNHHRLNSQSRRTQRDHIPHTRRSAPAIQVPAAAASSAVECPNSHRRRFSRRGAAPVSVRPWQPVQREAPEVQIGQACWLPARPPACLLVALELVHDVLGHRLILGVQILLLHAQRLILLRRTHSTGSSTTPTRSLPCLCRAIPLSSVSQPSSQRTKARGCRSSSSWQPAHARSTAPLSASERWWPATLPCICCHAAILPCVAGSASPPATRRRTTSYAAHAVHRDPDGLGLLFRLCHLIADELERKNTMANKSYIYIQHTCRLGRGAVAAPGCQNQAEWSRCARPSWSAHTYRLPRHHVHAQFRVLHLRLARSRSPLPRPPRAPPPPWPALSVHALVYAQRRVFPSASASSCSDTRPGAAHELEGQRRVVRVLLCVSGKVKALRIRWPPRLKASKPLGFVSMERLPQIPPEGCHLLHSHDPH